MTRGQNWRRIAAWTGLIVLGLALGAGLGVRAMAHWRLAPETYAFQGVNVSEAQGSIEWADTADCPTPPSHDAVIADLARFFARVEAHTGKPALVLVPKSIERRYGISAAIARPVWRERNLFKPDYTARPWRMWRANDMRRVEGIEGPVNWDVVAR